MNQIFVAFITGLTTGGLSCLAVQGGLLASSLEQHFELSTAKRSKHGRRHAANPELALPILLFLGAKILAYSLLGFILGALGSVFQLNVMTRAFLLIAIGVFMLGNALRMFNIHPIFRYFAIEPPKFITRYIRRTSKSDAAITPIFLGALTVLIPCGVTQAMIAVALTTGSPVQAAALMFAFTLGTSPVFFIVSYLATQVGSRTEGLFMRFVGVVILILGLVSIDSGATLLGSPYTLSRFMQNFSTAQQVASSFDSQSNTITLRASNSGYFPRHLSVPPNTSFKLKIITSGTYACSRDFVIPALGVEKLLPASGTVSVDIPAQPVGSSMQFTCSMGMYTGYITFDQ